VAIMAMALGVLAIPSSAFADHGGNNRNCSYTYGHTVNTGDLNPDPNQTAMVYGETAGNPRGGDAWDGSGTQGPHNRDGCTQPDIDFGR
jgi:hypothetical protein